MRAIEPKYILGRPEKEIRELMTGMSYHFFGDSRIHALVNPTKNTQFTLLFEPPEDHPANVVSVAFIENNSVSVTFIGENISILEWLEHHTIIVKSPNNLHHTLRFLPDTGILREDEDFWYNIRLSPNSKNGITIINKEMFPLIMGHD